MCFVFDQHLKAEFKVNDGAGGAYVQVRHLTMSQIVRSVSSGFAQIETGFAKNVKSGVVMLDL